MKKTVWVTGLLVLGAGLAIAANKMMNAKPKDTEPAITGEAVPLTDINLKDRDYLCTYKGRDGQGKGVIYISGSNFRDDFTGGDSVQSHAAFDGEYYYTWGDRGLPVKVAGDTALETTATDTARQIFEIQMNKEKKLGLTCLTWNLDKKLIAIPENFEFIDLTPKLRENQRPKPNSFRQRRGGKTDGVRNMIYTLTIAVGMAMDAFGVSATLGGEYKNEYLRRGVISSLIFGGFHLAMPALGWIIGNNFRSAVTETDHWIAFGLLVGIGLKMIQGAVRKKNAGLKDKLVDLRVILTLGLATSIDALVIGMGIALLDMSILLTCSIMGVVTFSLSMLGVYLGATYFRKIHNRAGLAGGVLLILIGVRILADHLWF